MKKNFEIRKHAEKNYNIEAVFIDSEEVELLFTEEKSEEVRELARSFLELAAEVSYLAAQNWRGNRIHLIIDRDSYEQTMMGVC